MVSADTRSDRADLAGAANYIGRTSRLGPAPILSVDATREELLSWLAWNDANGCYTDEACRVEGYDPRTLDEAWDELGESLADDAPHVWHEPAEGMLARLARQ